MIKLDIGSYDGGLDHHEKELVPGPSTRQRHVRKQLDHDNEGYLEQAHHVKEG
jgi:hypothetical protein